MKTCTTCRVTKEAVEFHVRRASIDGLALVCKTCSAAKSKAWYEQNRAKVIASSSAWAQANRIRRRNIVNAYDERNRDVLRKKSREYNKRIRQQDLPKAREIGRYWASVRRTRENDNGGTIEPEWWVALLNLFETGVCLYCGLYGQKLTMDHFVPVKLGGRTEIGNLMPCCKSCNSAKNATPPEQWLSPEAYEAVTHFLALTKAAHDEPLTIIKA